MTSSATAALLLRRMIREIAAASNSTASSSGRGRASAVAGARRRRLLSNAAAADNPHNQLHRHPVIASRRSVDRLRRSESQSGSGTGGSGNARAGQEGAGNQQKTKSEWPRSVRIGGYAAASMLVPYVLCSLVAELPGVRRLLEGDRPHDPTDHRLGKSVVDFVRRYWGEGDGLTFPGEDDADVRRTQTEIERAKDQPVAVEVSVGDGVRRAVGRVDGDVLLSSEVEILSGVGLDGDGHGEGAGPILIDFVESEEESGAKRRGAPEETGGGDDGADWTSTTTFSTGDDFASSLPSPESGDSSSEEPDAARQLRELTHTYSSWHHFPPSAASDAATGGADAKTGGATTGSATASELKISELEWREARLQGQLIDPNCTRDIDDMQAELAEVRGELRRLRGWRWKPW